MFQFYGEAFSPETNNQTFIYGTIVSVPKQGSTFNVSNVLLVGILTQISRQGNPLSNYLSLQEDIFFDAKVS